MNRYEKNEIQNIPSKYRPMGAWSYWGYTILFGIPLIGQIALLICALSSSNISRRSFARGYFCWMLVVLIIAGIAIGIMAGTGMLQEVIKAIQDAMQNLPQ